jgi:6,7-dimethyl-8-ribityllumazine synthase
MSTQLKNLSSYQSSSIQDAKGIRIGISLAKWNQEITNALYEGAIETLVQHGVNQDDIFTYPVPGSFELPLGAQWLFENKKVDAVLCLGCVIQGETRHFDFICHSVSKGIMDLNLKFSKPVIFGVLTTEDQQQALDRAGGKHGNKGIEAAATALQMLSLNQ